MSDQSAKWTNHAPVAQLDRALPSEGKGHTFELCRVRHFRLLRSQPHQHPSSLRASPRSRAWLAPRSTIRAHAAASAASHPNVRDDSRSALQERHAREQRHISEKRNLVFFAGGLVEPS